MTELAAGGALELRAAIDERWAEFQALIGALSEADRERPLGDGWSTKVHLAHLAAWERSLMGLLRGEHRGEAMGLPGGMWEANDLEATNRHLASRATGQAFDAVVSDSNAVHAEMLTLVATLTDDDLQEPYSHYQPGSPPDNPNPVVGWIRGNTFDHYEEHIGWLRAGIASEQPTT